MFWTVSCIYADLREIKRQRDTERYALNRADIPSRLLLMRTIIYLSCSFASKKLRTVASIAMSEYLNLVCHAAVILLNTLKFEL
jgi:hypothetical protein